jgi:hypothetical protein
MLGAIQALIADLPTYGYRRVHALSRPQAERDGRPAPDVKRKRCLRDSFYPADWERLSERVRSPSHVDVRAYGYVGAGLAPGAVYREPPAADLIR